MPKLKTHRGAAKRFKLTAKGKVKRGHSLANHILTKKTRKRKRKLRKSSVVSSANHRQVGASSIAPGTLAATVMGGLAHGTSVVPRPQNFRSFIAYR